MEGSCDVPICAWEVIDCLKQAGVPIQRSISTLQCASHAKLILSVGWALCLLETWSGCVYPDTHSTGFFLSVFSALLTTCLSWGVTSCLPATIFNVLCPCFQQDLIMSSVNPAHTYRAVSIDATWTVASAHEQPIENHYQTDNVWVLINHQWTVEHGITVISKPSFWQQN